MPPRDYHAGELVPGTVYRIVRPIGAGGMGTVYDVEDTTIGKRYVLKTLHPRLGSREDLARRMQNEARTLARLHHPNIVEVITAGVTADDLRLPFFVMERLDGQSLRAVLEKRGRLELPHAYNLVIDLLDALDHAHDRGIVHRDVKPDNIFLHRSPAGSTVTKLLDFGIVSLLDDAENETGRFLGTLRYAAPEQLRGEKPTPKTDVYASALVLYEILAGRGPFDDESDPHRVGQAHLHQRPPPLMHFAWVPTELNGLVMAALDKDPGVRPRDAFSFAASLRNIKRVYPSMPRTLRPSSAYDITDATISAVVDSSATDPESVGEISPATDFDPIGAVLSTHSIASGSSSATRIPNAGTDALTPSSPQGVFLSPAPTGDGADVSASAPAMVDDWSAERRPVSSVEPQIRSLPAASFPRRSRSAIAAACVGVAGLAALGLVLLRSPHGASATPATTAGATLIQAAGGDLPAPRGVVNLPAPTIAPPALEPPDEGFRLPPDVPVAAASAPGGLAVQAPRDSAAPPSTGSTSRRHNAGATSPSTVPASQVKPSARSTSSTPATGHRPGPGF